MQLDLRTVYAMNEKQMKEWEEICKAFAKREGAKLLFVDNSSCGLEYPSGNFSHLYIDEMIAYLKHEEIPMSNPRNLYSEEEFENAFKVCKDTTTVLAQFNCD